MMINLSAKLLLGLCFVLLLVGCEALGGANVPATLQAENLGYIAEATRIAQSFNRDAQRVEVTSAAALTEVASMQQANAELLVTVRAGETPLPAREVLMDSIPIQLEAGQRWFVKIGTSTHIRESDSCISQPQIVFQNGVSRIYAGVRAYNIEAGVRMSASWSYEGEVVHEEAWDLNRGSSNICMWFALDSSQVALSPGSWAVRLFADGFQLEEAMTFTIIE